MRHHFSILLSGQTRNTHRRASLLTAAVLAASAMSPASARQCEETNWQGGYESAIGLDRAPTATAVLDHDGDGVPSLFASNAGGSMNGTAVQGLARWTGEAWEQIGPDFTGSVAAILRHDLDGDGNASLLVAGVVRLEPDGPQHDLIEWNGSGWTVRSSVGAGGPFLKDALAVDLDGDGVATLFATRSSSSVPSDTQALVRWSKAGWVAVDPARTVSLSSDGSASGMLAAHDDDGDGVASLYAAVHVRDGASLVARGLARWDGAAFAAPSMASNPPLVDGRIESMVSGDLDADGVPDLVIAGRVTAFPQPAGSNGIVVLEAGSWSVPGSVLINTNGASESVAIVYSVAYADDDGDGDESLFATGWFSRAGTTQLSRIARFEGSDWIAVGAGLSGAGTSIEVLPNAKSGEELVVTGSFTTAGSVWCRGTARWNGAAWSALGSPAATLGVDSVVYGSALVDLDDDGAESVVAVGQFRFAGAAETQGVAHFDGSQWVSLGGLAHWTSGGTAALAADLDGDGTKTLYVAGIGSASSVGAFEPGATDGWTQLGANLTQQIDALIAIDHDGDGVQSLFAAGRPFVGGSPSVLQWTGSAWIALGLANAFSGAESVNSLVAFDDDGDGVASLFAALGKYDPNFFLNRVRKWNGTSWVTVGAITKGHAFKLQAIDHDGDGSQSLVAHGQFMPAGSASVSFMMTLASGTWTVFGPSTTDYVRAQAGAWLQWFDDDGDGTASLFLSNYDPFYALYGSMRRLDGSSWTMLASDMGYGMVTRHEVDLDHDGARSLFMLGGTFALAGAFGSGVAEIEQCVSTCTGDLDGDAEVGASDLSLLLASWGACGQGACAADLDSDGEVGASDLSLLLASWGACR